MNDQVENIVLEHLKRIQNDIATLSDGQQTIIQRLGSLEIQTAGVRSDITRIDHRIDTVEKRLMRIERRLDLVEA